MPEIVWTAAYPRSGTTYLRSMMYHVRYGGLPTQTVDIMDRFPEGYWPYPNSGLGNPAPDLSGETYICVNTHQEILPETNQPENLSYCSFDHLDVMGAIVIFRNPIEVMNSCYNLLSLRNYIHPDVIDFPTFADQFISSGGLGNWMTQFPTINRFTNDWLDWDQPKILINYDNLMANPEVELERACDFVGYSHTPQALTDAVTDCSREQMITIEDAERGANQMGLYYDPSMNATRRWFTDPHEGFLNELSAGQRDAANQEWGEIIARLDALGITFDLNA